MRITAVIIDDDKDSRLILRSHLDTDFPEIIIAGEGASVSESLTVIEKIKPDLLLLDISLPDGTGFDLLEKITDKNFEVIFITSISVRRIITFTKLKLYSPDSFL